MSKSVDKILTSPDFWNKHMVPLGKTWTRKFDQLAKKEGWAIFSCNGGSADGKMQIQSIDDPEEGDAELKERDGEAYTLVCQKALAGSKMHLLALFLDGRDIDDIYIPRILIDA